MGYLDKVNQFAKSSQNAVNDALGDVGELVIERVCFIRNKYPNRFVQGGLLSPVLDRLCVENNQLPTPVRQIFVPGGQCDKQYYINACVECDRYTIESTSNIGTFRNKLYASLDTQGQFIARGPIESITFATTGDCPKVSGGPVVCTYGRQEVTMTVVAQNGTFQRIMPLRTDGCFAGAFSELGGSSYVLEDSLTVVDLTIRTTDGSPDDCGQLGGYPPDPTIDSADFNGTVQICGTPGDIENERCVDVAIDFEPFLDDNGNQCYTIDGDRYCFTPDGVEKQDEPTECIKEPPPIDDLAPTTEEDSENSEEDDSAIAYVTTEITTFPFSGKTILQSDSNDNDYFAGYFNWTTSRPDGSYRHPAIPIRKRLQIFTRPASATGYKAYTVNGAKLRITVYKEQGENSDGT